MRTKIPTAITALVALGCVVCGRPTMAQTTAPEDERHVIVDVQRGTGPHVWHTNWGGYLGVGLVELTPELRAHFGVPEDAGVMIGSVEAESPAAAAGLEVGDILTAVDDAPMTSRSEVARAISGKADGESVTLAVFRDGRTLELTAEVEQRRRPQLLIGPVGEDGSYAFRWKSDDGAEILSPAPPPGSPPPGAPPFEGMIVEPERLSEIMEELSERLDDPDFKSRMLDIRTNTERLEGRIRELEQRLSELSAKLDELER